MDKTFLIDDRLAFHSSRNELVSLTRADLAETLNAPSARCLEQLLNTPGQIISQTELYKAGWGEGWKEVSPNTLYQNILLARKALRNISESDDEFIITVPRKGFRFNEDIPVTDRDLSLLADIKEVTGSTIKPPASTGRPLQDLIYRLLVPVAGVLLILAAAVYTLGVYRFDTFHDDDFTGDYIFFHTRAGCDIYLSKRETRPVGEMEHLLDIWPDITSGCSRLPVRYVTPYRNHLSVFYLSCDSKDKADRICSSGYLRLSE